MQIKRIYSVDNLFLEHDPEFPHTNIISKEPLILDQGYPQTWPIKQYTDSIAKCWLSNNISSNAKKQFLWDFTWTMPGELSHGTDIEPGKLTGTDGQLALLSKYGPYDVGVCHSFIDETRRNDGRQANIDIIYNWKKITKTIYCLGYVHSADSDGIKCIPLNIFPILIRELYPKYKKEDLVPGDFENIYLSYNRKPHRHRIDLYKTFDAKKLFSKGIFTFNIGQEQDAQLANRVIEEPLVRNTWIFDDPRSKLASSDDSSSLGDLNIWNSYFINIVTETEWEDSSIYYEFPFMSEKTFKPIMGLRPFFIIGHNGIYDWLLNKGFRTFQKYFGFPDNYHLEITEIAEVVETLTLRDCELLYKDMLQDINHNYTRFHEFANEICREQNLLEFIRE